MFTIIYVYIYINIYTAHVNSTQKMDWIHPWGMITSGTTAEGPSGKSRGFPSALCDYRTAYHL